MNEINKQFVQEKFIKNNTGLTHFVDGTGVDFDPYLLAPATTLKDGLLDAFTSAMDPKFFPGKQPVFFNHNARVISLNQDWELTATNTDGSLIPEEDKQELYTLVAELRKKYEGDTGLSEVEKQERDKKILELVEESKMWKEKDKRRRRGIGSYFQSFLDFLDGK